MSVTTYATASDNTDHPIACKVKDTEKKCFTILTPHNARSHPTPNESNP